MVVNLVHAGTRVEAEVVDRKLLWVRAVVAGVVLALIGISLPSVSAPARAEVAAATSTRDELVEERTATSKTYRNPDGSLTTALFNAPVHFKQNGDWFEIDSDLVEAQRPGYTWRNRANGFDVFFKDHLADDFLALRLGGQTVSMSLQGATRVPSDRASATSPDPAQLQDSGRSPVVMTDQDDAHATASPSPSPNAESSPDATSSPTPAATPSPSRSLQATQEPIPTPTPSPSPTDPQEADSASGNAPAVVDGDSTASRSDSPSESSDSSQPSDKTEVGESSTKRRFRESRSSTTRSLAASRKPWF